MKQLACTSLLLIITLCVICSESKICLTIKKSQNVMNIIADFKWLNLFKVWGSCCLTFCLIVYLSPWSICIHVSVKVNVFIQKNMRHIYNYSVEKSLFLDKYSFLSYILFRILLSFSVIFWKILRLMLLIKDLFIKRLDLGLYE